MKTVLIISLGLILTLIIILGVETELPVDRETSTASVETAVQAVGSNTAKPDTLLPQPVVETRPAQMTDEEVVRPSTGAQGQTNSTIWERGRVISVVDGDTLKVQLGARTETIRVIGIDTPETVHPSKPEECFGREASAYAKALLLGTAVTVETDPAQGERDKYDRLLGYITLEDGQDFGMVMIQEGYAYEYTYDGAYAHQARYQLAEVEAQTAGRGLWALGVCDTFATGETRIAPPPSPLVGQSCDIKGNISRSGEKIFHVPGQSYYTKTVITVAAGERYFCTEAEAIAAGWRKALQ